MFLYDQHSISVRSELVSFLESDFIGVHDVLETSEGCNGHEHRGFRGMEVGHDRIRDGEFVWREDELVGPCVHRIHFPARGHVGLKRTDDGHTDSHYLVAFTLGPVDDIGGFLIDDVSLCIGAVLGQVLDIHSAEMSDTHVYCYERLVYVLENHSVEAEGESEDTDDEKAEAADNG